MTGEIVPIPVDGDYVVKLAQELIRIPAENPPGDCTEVAGRILSELKSIGVDRVETHEFKPGQPNFIIQAGDGGEGGFAATSMVPGADDKWTIEVKPDRGTPLNIERPLPSALKTIMDLRQTVDSGVVC